MLSQRPQVEAAVHVDDLGGGEGEAALGAGADRGGHVGGQAPAADRREPFADHLVVFLLDGRRHVRRDDAGANLVHADPMLGQAGRQSLVAIETPAFERQYSPRPTLGA